MTKYLTIILYSLFLYSCSEVETEKPTRRKLLLKQFESYVNSEINDTTKKMETGLNGYSLDTNFYELKSINTILFFVRTPQGIVDGNQFLIIFDEGSKNYYKLIQTGWRPYGMDLPNDLQLKILGSNYLIEPMLFHLSGLEAFLNQNKK